MTPSDDYIQGLRLCGAVSAERAIALLLTPANE